MDLWCCQHQMKIATRVTIPTSLKKFEHDLFTHQIRSCASSQIGMPWWRVPDRSVALVFKCIQQATLDDHSEVVPPLPIPNRTVKHLSADDSGCTSVKVGHRQALIPQTPKCHKHLGVCLCATGFSLNTDWRRKSRSPALRVLRANRSKSALAV